MITRNFGIEIEFKGNALEAAVAINAAGVECEVEGYNHNTRPHWKIVSDASVARTLLHGGELVSPILSGAQGVEVASKAVAALATAGARVDRACGFHVHIDIADFNLRQAKNLVKMFAKYEDILDAYVAPSRRSNANRFCQSNYAGFTPYVSANVPPSAAQAAACSRLFERIDACTTIDSVMSVYGNSISSRYHKLNTLAYFRHRTIEFRQHQGTTDAKKVAMWIELCQYIVQCAKNIPQVAPLKDNGKFGASRQANFWCGQFRPELKQFYLQRAKDLKGRAN